MTCVHVGVGCIYSAVKKEAGVVCGGGYHSFLYVSNNSCFPGMPELDEYTMERVIEEFEQRCYDNMNHAIETEEGLGIEYDEDVVCDVCQSPDGEDGNEMVFCDKCNICVHQVWQPGHSGGV